MLIVINNVTGETLKDMELVVKSVKYRIIRAITLVDPIFFSSTVHCNIFNFLNMQNDFFIIDMYHFKKERKKTTAGSNVLR